MKDSTAKDMDSLRPSRPSELAPGIRPTAPSKIGRYELCFELASGGMASVHLARVEGNPGFEKLVALKRIHPHLANEREYIEMFLDEARIASRITHSNVCSVFDFGEVDGEYFIAMEYLVGEPLSRVHRRVLANIDQRGSPLLPARMARIIAQACEGLHAAHELTDGDGESLHVVHRDVSADNLFVTYDGATQVVDFGIAHARQRVHSSDAGQIKGRFPYMAPEQMTSAVVDRRVDVWALGAVLWELLTLRKLFLKDTDVNTMYAVLSSEIRAPSDFRAEVSEELDEIVLKALRRSPDERWQSAREMGKALRRYLAKQEELIGPAEIADWMRELFPSGELRKRELMAIARSSDANLESGPPVRPALESRPEPARPPVLMVDRMPPAPPLPASLLVMLIGVVTVLAVVTFDWLRQ
jgi:serine/threonine-protein kinase